MIARGAAITAGLAVEVWKDIHSIPPLPNPTTYKPNIEEAGM